MEPTIRDAINKLCYEKHPNSGVRIIGKDNELKSLSCLKIMDGSNPSFKWEGVEKKLFELKAEYDANQYQRDRAADYPTWQEQMDLIYHSGVEGLKAELKKTKDKYPKG